MARDFHTQVPCLRTWDPADLVQEVFLRALVKLDQFRGDASLKTWVSTLARNHLICMARAAAYRPRAAGDEVHPPSNDNADKRLLLRSSTSDLLAWLRENPEEVECGWQVLNLMLWSHGDCNYVALALCLHTGSPWTVERVRSTVRSIRKTAKGFALCESLGIRITKDGKE